MDQQTERLEEALCRVKTEISGEIGQLSESVGKLNAQVELQAKEIKSVKTHVGLLQKAVSDDRGRISTLESKVETLARKAVDIEDRSCCNNVRLVGLAEGAEGSDAVGFLRINLPICAATTAKRKTFSSAMKMATLKLRLGTGPKLFDDAASAMDFIHRQPPASGNTDNAPERRGKARRNLFAGESGSATPESGQMQEMDVHGEDVAVDQ
ncbi:unnamed protein product [Merluccius merluccius]